MLVVVSAIAIGVVAYKSTERTVEAFVESKERVCESSNECKYLVFTDEGTFSLSDSLIYGRWRSSDIYGRLKTERTYSFDVAGWRLPFFST